MRAAVLKDDQHMGILLFAVKLVLDLCSGSAGNSRDDVSTVSKLSGPISSPGGRLSRTTSKDFMANGTSSRSVSRSPSRSPMSRPCRRIGSRQNSDMSAGEADGLEDDSTAAVLKQVLDAINKQRSKDKHQQSRLLEALIDVNDAVWATQKTVEDLQAETKSLSTRLTDVNDAVWATQLTVEALQEETHSLASRMVSLEGRSSSPGVGVQGDMVYRNAIVVPEARGVTEPRPSAFEYVDRSPIASQQLDNVETEHSRQRYSRFQPLPDRATPALDSELERRAQVLRSIEVSRSTPAEVIESGRSTHRSQASDELQSNGNTWTRSGSAVQSQIDALNRKPAKLWNRGKTPKIEDDDEETNNQPKTPRPIRSDATSDGPRDEALSKAERVGTLLPPQNLSAAIHKGNGNGQKILKPDTVVAASLKSIFHHSDCNDIVLSPRAGCTADMDKQSIHSPYDKIATDKKEQVLARMHALSLSDGDGQDRSPDTIQHYSSRSTERNGQDMPPAYEHVMAGTTNLSVEELSMLRLAVSDMCEMTSSGTLQLSSQRPDVRTYDEPKPDEPRSDVRAPDDS